MSMMVKNLAQDTANILPFRRDRWDHPRRLSARPKRIGAGEALALDLPTDDPQGVGLPFAFSIIASIWAFVQAIS
jgi:hypothetical protein